MPRDPRRVEVLPVSHDKGCRSYVVVDPASRDACVVDPLLDRVPEILRLLQESGGRLRWIVDTHSHADHLSGAAALRERTGAEVVMHPAAPSDVATVRPGDGDLLPFGEEGLRVHHAPGNTADAIVLEAPGALFTGDTLLIGTVGLSDAPGTDAAQWFETLHRIFGSRPETTVIHPGHDDMGRTMTTLKQQRTGNAWLREQDLEAFRRRLAADDRPRRKDGEQLLQANRQGLQRVPRDLEAASGLPDPAHATEARIQERPPWAPPAAPQATGVPDGLRMILLAAGVAAVLGTLLGWVTGRPLLHALSGLAGLVVLGALLPRSSGPRRKAAQDGGLYYEGPLRKTIAE
jgi:glyoxylase-like metal-dependent hydrolase (beta-lactamase superfamily II)